MLNRRILRFKVLQSVYACVQAQRSTESLALDLIAQQFEPDLNAMVQPDPKAVETAKNACLAYFETHKHESYLEDLWGSESSQEPLSTEQKDIVRKAFVFFKKGLRQDIERSQAAMLDDVYSVQRIYVSLLHLLILFANRAYGSYQERKKRQFSDEIVYETELKLWQNPIIELLRKHTPLEELINSQSLYWDEEMIKIWFKKLRLSDFYQAYLQEKETTQEQDRELLQTILRDFIFKEEEIVELLEKECLDWATDYSVIKNMLTKTLRTAAEHLQDPLAVEFRLRELSVDWENDREFFLELFAKAIEQEEYHESLIAENLQGWDISRIALIDKLIVKIALTEILTFPSIPLKVSINEYVELAKSYGSDKSKDFVNGILDKIAIQLKAEGKIKKSGRGLLDSK
ncbi:transcription antitermination factor NusB [Hugenholtzia roseola]|uniref:transcription antitermination factor NusB n=1 Tax=Hugenholtzia roseola TaxID=1002 RepID=UPI0013779AC6|nr:transcription antitermination factor NusB [Hugenholtzia roseola]